MTNLTYDLPLGSKATMNISIRWNEIFFIVLLTITAVMNIADFIGDYQDGSPAWHLVHEAFVVAASIGGISYLLWVMIQRRQEMDRVKLQLKQANRNLSESNEKLRDVSRQYREVIDQQFKTWSLTPTEKEVAMLLLKGLSFEEVAGVRDSKEKTVRQHATAIYRKSGLSGRHELAAWFFEDFLG